LSQEELPDFYEENLDTLAGIMTWVMEVDFNFGGRTPEELIKCRSKAISLVQLYQSKFLEHFSKYSHFFFEKIWNMVLNKWVLASKQNEKLIQNMIKYLSEMSNYPDLSGFFKSNMLNIFTLIIVPNISITDDDLEEYEFEPDTYVKNDLEESDTETRRRQCMKFVQQLSRKYSQEVVVLIDSFVNQLMSEYTVNREKEWIKKTTVLNLIITASISSYTYR